MSHDTITLPPGLAVCAVKVKEMMAQVEADKPKKPEPVLWVRGDCTCEAMSNSKDVQYLHAIGCPQYRINPALIINKEPADGTE